MIRKPIFSFDNLSSTDVDQVPLRNLICVEDADGLGTPLYVILIDDTGITETTTINEFLTDTSLWAPLDGSSAIPPLDVTNIALTNIDNQRSAIDISNLDLDTNVAATGFYKGTNVTNAPDLEDWYFTVIRNDATNAHVTAVKDIASDQKHFVRTQIDGVWGAWKQLGFMSYDSETGTLYVSL